MPSSTIKPDPFYDRTVELAALDRAWKRHGNGGQMLLLYGRRRLGKTFLLQRYFTAGATGNEPAKPHCYYLAEQSTAAAQQLSKLWQSCSVTDQPNSQDSHQQSQDHRRADLKSA